MRKITILFMALVLTFAVNAQKQKSSNQNERNLNVVKVQKHVSVNNGAKDITSVTYLNESFESATFPPTGWSLLSPDGGTGWMRTTDGTTPMPGWTGGIVSVPANGGTACAYCTWNTGGAASNDQWLITPQLSNIQADDTVKFWCRRAQIAFLDELQIKISTGTATAPADFTISGPTFAFPAGSGDSAWTQYVIPIGALVPAGSNVYVGFREVVADNQTDGASISLDKVTWGALPVTPVASISTQTWAAGDVVVGTTKTSAEITLQNVAGGTLTVSGISGLTAPYTTTLVPASINLASDQTATFTVTFSPTVVGAANQTMTIATNAGDLTIALTGNGIECATISTYPWNEGFENATLDPCHGLNDVDADGFNWMLAPDFRPHGGSSCLVSASWDYDSQTALTPDNYYITPKFNINSSNLSLAFWAAGSDVEFFGENYSVLVSTTGTAPANFTEVYTETLTDSVWHQVNVPLTSYNGQQIYIAFRHHNCTDMFYLRIDDLFVGNTTGVAENSKELVSIYPNPANDKLFVSSSKINTVEIYNLTGAKVAAFGNQNVINISDLAQGTYLVKVITDNKVTTQKINIVR